MTYHYISIGRRKYAVGLVWQPLGVGYIARNYAHQLARSMDKKFNLYSEYRAMVGLGASRLGLRPGMPSAAAGVVDAFSEFSSFLAVFRVDSGFYLVAVRNGIILQDTLFDNESAARGRYVELSQIPDWGAFFAPGSWAMPRAVERRIDDVMAGRSRGVLHRISRMRANILSVTLMGLFVFALMYFFRTPIAEMMTPRPQISKIDPELAAEYKRQIAEKNKELDQEFDVARPTPPPPLVMPYDNLPSPMARAQLCYQAIALLMQPVVGWTQTSVDCGEEYATATFTRTFGTIGGFYEIATELMPGGFVVERSDAAVSVRMRLPQLASYASLDERDADTIVRDVATAFQAIDTPVDTDIVVDTITNGVETRHLPVVEIAASSKLTPMAFMEIFQEFSGVYMTRCVWNAGNKTWNYEVIVYAK